MADNFERNDSELFGQTDMSDLSDLDQLLQNMQLSEPEEPVQEEQPVQTEPPVRPRRKRRRKRPKWQRLLWKYWPPIRFGLIILAAVLLLWLLISSIGSVFRGDAPDDESSGSSQTDGATDSTPPPTETDPPETTVPTTPPTDPPVTDPFAGAVDDSWYDNTLFIGDFGVTGLRDNGRVGSADYYCSSGMGVFNYDDQSISDTNFEEQNLSALLAAKSYDKVIIHLGINDCGYPTSSLMNGYTELVDLIRTAQPEAKIILHGILMVTSNYASRADYFSLSHINSVNDEIALLADGVNVFYIDVNASFADTSGYLDPSVSTDGCHLTSAGYADWAKLISVEVGKLEID